MDWTYPANSGDTGIFEIGRRLAVHLGRMPDVTRFVHDAREMLRVTRRVESAARAGTLYVGFQTAAKLDAEADRYRDLVAAGTHVVAFGTDQPDEAIPGLEYHEQAPSYGELRNQWFLVSTAPEPVAFVSWETSGPRNFGVGGAASPGKRFVGFVSDDPAVVAELIRELDARPPSTPRRSPTEAVSFPATLERDAAKLASEVRAVTVGSTNASLGSVVVPVGRGESLGAVTLALAVARQESRQLVVVDRSAESLFTSPYSGVRADDEFRPRRDSLFDVSLAWREGRGSTASVLRAAEVLGVEAGGWFPTATGAEGLKAAIDCFGGALLVLPTGSTNPGIAERIRGMTRANLEQLGVPLLIAGE